MRAGVLAESAPGERRVALTPDAVKRLADSGFELHVESDAGKGARFSDSEYVDAGAHVAEPEHYFAR